MRRIDAHLIVVQGDEALTLHLSDQRIDDARQLRFFPAQEQLGLQERIEHLDVTQDFGTGNTTMLSDDGG